MGYVIAKNDEITLMMPDWHEGMEDLYEIILNNTGESLGFLTFHHEIHEVTGNVEYHIFEEHRGNNYAKKALKLFSNNVYKISDDDLFIAILPTNIASIKTAKGAGAIFEQKVEIPKHFVFSEDGKYKYANMYVIKNNGGKIK